MLFGGGENKFHVAGRLLQGLEEGVEGLVGKHMDLIDDVDLIVSLGGCILALFPKEAHVLDAVVGSTVDFDDIHAGAVHDGAGDLGIVVGIRGRAALGIEGFGEEPGGGGLSGSPRTDKEKGMSDPLVFDGIGQGPDDMVLPDQLIELLGAPTSGNDLVSG